MKNPVTFLFILLILILHTPAMSQNPDRGALTGSWMGKIMAGAIPLRIVFNLSVIGKDSLVATLDSPDQGAKNIKLGPVTFNGSTIKISAGAMLAEYNGTVRNDTLIEGTWSQAGTNFPLNISKLRNKFAINRPQEPRPPFPYAEEEVTFTNEKYGIKLSGTLTIPNGNGTFPAAILITGSGAQNRNEGLLGHKPFWIIADYLTRRGIAVLRYDDRGVGKSQGNYNTVTSADLATDAEAAFNFLKANPKINKNFIGLIGHSEGGIIAPIVASKKQEIAYIVSLAGSGVPGEKVVLRQAEDISRASGVSEDEIRESISTNKKIYSILKSEPDNKKAEEKILEAYKAILDEKNTTPEEAEKLFNQIKLTFGSAMYTWFRYFITTDPAVFWKEVKCPVLALNGEKDLQVAAGENLPAIEKALNSGGNSNVKIILLPDLNHLFQHTKTGLPSEYGEIEETFSTDALKLISDWILGLEKDLRHHSHPSLLF